VPFLPVLAAQEVEESEESKLKRDSYGPCRFKNNLPLSLNFALTSPPSLSPFMLNFSSA
jgi:hypothetical protein